MDPQHVAEERPLLQSPVETDDLAWDSSSTRKPTGASQHPGLALVVPCLLLILLAEIGSTLITTPMSQIQEGIICQSRHSGILDPSKDIRCKDGDVQSELSTIQGWDLTFGLVPGLITAVPYGIAADKYGRKVILSLSLFGVTLVQAADMVICWFPGTFPLRLIWLGALFTVVGGGPYVVSAMIFAIASDVSNEAQRSTVFFYLAAATIGGELIAGPIAYLAMARGAWFSVFVGVGCLSAAVLVALTFPETRDAAKRGETTRNDGDDNDFENSYSVPYAGLRAWSHLALKQVTTSVRSYFWDDKRLGLLLFSLIFTSLSKYVSTILMQYTTKRYHWSWAEAALLSSVSGSVKLALVAALLPLVSRLLLSRVGLNPLVKDLYLVRASISVLTIGALGIGLAPNSVALVASLMVFALGYGYSPAMRSLLTLLAGHRNTGTLFTAISVLETTGALVAGPLMATMFRTGLTWGESWTGLPFITASVMFTCTAIIVFSIRLHK